MEENSIPQGRSGGQIFRRETGMLVTNPLRGVMDQFHGIAQMQLVLDIVAVGFDGFEAQTERFGNFSSALSSAKHSKYLQLAIGEHLRSLVLFSSRHSD